MDRYEIATALLRGLHMAASMSLFGCLMFRVCVVPNEAAGIPLSAVNRIAWGSAVLAFVLGAAWLAAVSGTIAGANDFASLLNALPVVARHTSFGNFVCARLLLLAGVLLVLAFQGPRSRLVALLGAGAALALQPLLGHLGASDGRMVLVPIEMAHLLAGGAWLGSLPPLLICVLRAPAPTAARLCERFTPVGLVAVGTIAVTALPQAGELIGGLGGLFGTQYGHFALIKMGLFLAALALACVNRLVLTPRAGTDLGRRGLVVSIAIEAVAVFGIVLAAGGMASSAPAAHVQPVWPFSWRPSLVAWDEPELRSELVQLMIAAAAALVLIGASLLLRRFRPIALVVAVVIILPFVQSLNLLLVEAYPTSYARSHTGFAVDSIAHGESLFAERCAVCHDPQIGAGGAADLTAPHLWGHTDGELFWWVTNGVQDPEGAALMPAFGPVLSEDDRWALIDFIRARNVGRQQQTSGHWAPPVPAPFTRLNCAGIDADTTADLLTHELLVVVEDDNTETPPGAGNGLSAVPIRLGRGESGQPAPGECVVASADAWEAWRILAGATPGHFAGFRAVVDPQGWLRAWLAPNASADRVLAAERDARDHPIAAGSRPTGGHHH